MKRPARFPIESILLWLVAPLFGVGVYYVYRWAEPAPLAVTAVNGAIGTTVKIRLENAPLESSVNGRKTWSIFAKSIDLTRPGQGGLGNIQSAALTGIRDGILFQQDVNLTTASVLHTAASTDLRPVNLSPAGVPTATFRADHGQYLYETQELIPLDLSALYKARWQFRLTGNVDFKTRAGDRLQSQSITILDLVDLKSQQPERRILCDQGADITRGSVRIHANQARFNPDDRTVECSGGVRGGFKSNVLQTERMYWSLNDQVLRCPQTAFGSFTGGTVQANQMSWSVKDQILRCPGTATGTIQGVPFTSTDLIIDGRRKQMRAAHIQMSLKVDPVSLEKLGALQR